MSNIVPLECACGAVKGSVAVVAHSFFHVQCLCCDCQKYADYLANKEQILDQYGATELFQTYPSLMKITNGQDHIACVQLRQKGLYRWYTKCCNTPLANTMTNAKVPFVGIPVTMMKFTNEQQKMAILGPITLKAFGKYALGTMPTDAHAKFPLSFIPKILAFMVKGMLTQKSEPSPFFKNKKPIVKSKVLP